MNNQYFELELDPLVVSVKYRKERGRSNGTSNQKGRKGWIDDYRMLYIRMSY
jgi:hypothetical protein